MAKATLTQIYYDDDQLSSLYPFARPFKNENLTIFFENSVIASLVPTIDDDRIAICSWRLREKMHWQLRLPRELTQQVLDESEFDVLSFTNNSRHHKMLAAADVWHKGFSETFFSMLEGINVPRPFAVRDAIYQNHFCARADIYKAYVSTYLQPAMDLMMNDPAMHAKVMVDSMYVDNHRKGSEFLQQRIGLPYYPLAPFLLERLFSVYCANNHINVSWL